ncbi:MAG: hypothetical protein ACERJ1_08750 [Halodesulfovibrio sp.]|uniref:hypothetical protein n=1 Tax=Halodesulfovibrio sp. TaxID=1912772 RepID=UPI00359DC508
MKNNAVLVYADLVRYWLRIEPSEDMDEFGEEVARAMVMEERFMQQQAMNVINLLAKNTN